MKESKEMRSVSCVVLIRSKIWSSVSSSPSTETRTTSSRRYSNQGSSKMSIRKGSRGTKFVCSPFLLARSWNLLKISCSLLLYSWLITILRPSSFVSITSCSITPKRRAWWFFMKSSRWYSCNSLLSCTFVFCESTLVFVSKSGRTRKD